VQSTELLQKQKGGETLNTNAERERNFAKCWGFGGKYFAKFASRVFEFFGEWAPKTKKHFIRKSFLILIFKYGIIKI
jgi:hypothetical protein